MKASKFSDAQKAFILKQGNDGVPVAEICRKAGISQAIYFNWKKKYDGLLQRLPARRVESKMPTIGQRLLSAVERALQHKFADRAPRGLCGGIQHPLRLRRQA